MKRIILLIALWMPLMGFSQDDKMNIHLVFSPNVNWLSTDNTKVTPDGNQTGYLINLLTEFNLGERFGLTAGVGFALLQGGRLKYEQGGNLWNESKLNFPKADSLPNGVVLNYRANFFEIPIGLKIKSKEIGKYKFFIQAPELILGMRTGAKGIIETGNSSSDKEKINSQVAFFNLAWAIGIGGQYELSDDLYLTGGLRYRRNISDFTDDSGTYFDGSKEKSKALLNALDIRIGILF